MEFPITPRSRILIRVGIPAALVCWTAGLIFLGRAPSSPDAVIAALQANHVRLERDETHPARPVVMANIRTGPTFQDDLRNAARLPGLRKLVLDDLTQSDRVDLSPFAGIHELAVHGSTITSDHLTNLCTLKDLLVLDLSYTNVHSDGLAALNCLASLRSLLLAGTSVEGLAHLAPKPQLRTLSLSSCPIDDDGLATLAGMTEMEVLFLDGTRVTGPGLRHLSSMVHLRELYLVGSPVSDDGLSHLTHLSDLQQLALGNTRITEAGLVHLSGLKKLRFLGLMGIPVTDAGLKPLTGLSHLETLFLTNTQVSPSGLKDLQTALPKTKIIP